MRGSRRYRNERKRKLDVRMNGQWIGRYTGTNQGFVVIELDDMGGQFEGALFATDANPAFPTVFGEFVVPKGSGDYKVRIDLVPIQRGTGMAFSEEMFKKAYPNAVAPKFADAQWEFDGNQMVLAWRTDINTEAKGIAFRSRASERSELSAQKVSWDEFKSYAVNLPLARYLFRGQESNIWKLRTAFHRTGRANLAKFMRQDVGALYAQIVGLVQHRMNLSDPLDYAAFLALAQHHGYPTPLLDWTLSPFVAAYFAFKGVNERAATEGERVRIFAFDGFAWNNSLERAAALHPGFLHLTLLQPLALNNPRVLPQQAFALVTNVDDIEAHIGQIEQPGQKFLTAFDLPVAERQKVLRELALMGISGGSLFPGLDGACAQLRERFFS